MKLIWQILLFGPLVLAQPSLVKTLGIDSAHLVELDGHQLTSTTADAFCAMQTAAQQDGIDVQLVSAYRSFLRQQQIFEDKYTRYTLEGMTPQSAIKRILEYSTIPGTSRHHWGTDIDITDGNVTDQKRLLVPKKFHNNGPFAHLHQWMQANAHRFGFYLVYTNDNSRTGFAYEPWHYTYLPEAKSFLAAYDPNTAYAFFKSVGVEGSKYITRDFWKDYYTQFVLGVNREVLGK